MAKKREFTENAKLVRRGVYKGFLTETKSVGWAELLKRTGLAPLAREAMIEVLERELIVICPQGTHDIVKACADNDFFASPAAVAARQARCPGRRG